MSDVLLVAAVFLACVVEAVEALTIVLAAGLSRGWRSALQGVGAGIIVLALIVAALGPALAVVPMGWLRVLIGGLLLIFGLGWLRKAILRAGGYQQLHDEDAIFARQVGSACTAGRSRVWLVADWYAFTLSFKGVVLEGLEVVFIVLTVGSNQGSVALAAAGAAGAVIVVSIAGIMVRAPLARIPENTLKFAVGVLLTSFGIFWGAEGAGATWPGGDIAILGVLVAVAATAVILTVVLRRGGAPATHEPEPVR